MDTDSYRQQLIDYLLAVSTPAAMENALGALLTPSELDEIAKRLQIFNKLKDGIPQRRIAEELKVGIATVSRGARALKNNQD